MNDYELGRAEMQDKVEKAIAELQEKFDNTFNEDMAYAYKIALEIIYRCTETGDYKDESV